MQTIATLLLLTYLTAQAAVAADSTPKRPRDGYQKPVPVDADTTKKIIAAIRRYRDVLATGDYRQFYRDCFHRVAKERQTEEAFARQAEAVAPKLKQFFSDILDAYEKGLHHKADFQIGRMPSPRVKDTFMIQFADRIDDTTAKRWAEGRPVRIELAPDGESLRFYDID